MLRDDAGRLNGVLLERRCTRCPPAMPQPTAERNSRSPCVQARYFAEYHAPRTARPRPPTRTFTSDAARARLKIDLALPIYTGLDAAGETRHSISHLSGPCEDRRGEIHPRRQPAGADRLFHARLRTRQPERRPPMARAADRRARKSSTRWLARSTTAAGRYSSRQPATPRSIWRSRASMRWGSRPPTIAAHDRHPLPVQRLTRRRYARIGVGYTLFQYAGYWGDVHCHNNFPRKWSILSAPFAPRADQPIIRTEAISA